MKFRLKILLFVLTFICTQSFGQTLLDQDDNEIGKAQSFGSKKNSKEEKDNIPIGLKTWQITDTRFGVCDSVRPDTMPENFQNTVYTEGMTGQYNSLGNVGSPRLSRIVVDRPRFTNFFFSQPYDFFLTPISSFQFTNTRSPITNITYHEGGGSDDGEDRIKALYAINSGKDIGIGFKLDYLYGRGFYDSQSTAHFNATLYGSVLKERYKAHIMLFANYLKNSENGGITDDEYITNPEKFPSSYQTRDIPTNFDKVWNKMHINGIYLTHNYSIGYYKTTKNDATTSTTIDTTFTTLAEPQINDSLIVAKDTIAVTASSNTNKPQGIQEFVPVTRFIHTMTIGKNSREFTANENLNKFYSYSFLEGDSAKDEFGETYVNNMLAIELCEGLNKYLPTGIRVFAQHEFSRFSMPETAYSQQKHIENAFTLGGMIMREKSNYFNYHVLAQTTMRNNTWSDHELSAAGNLKAPILKDTFNLSLRAGIVKSMPTFFYRNYQSHYLSWNNNLDCQTTTYIGGTLSSKKTKTRLSVDIQNISNFTYFANETTLGTENTINTKVCQSGDNIQLASIRLNQDFRLGILNWENEIAYQEVSDKEILPVPKLSIYSNLYLLFRIAKVLRVQFGGDIRYFTKYYAPTYSPAIGMFANQVGGDTREEIGGYPIVNAYVNFHLKHTRFYVMASHVNYSKNGGNSFLVPHYPIQPFHIRLGLSWNFFN